MQSWRQSRVWGLDWKSWHSSTSGRTERGMAGAPANTESRLTPCLPHPHPLFTMAHTAGSHLEAGVAAAAPGARAAFSTAGLAAEGGVAQHHPVCGAQRVSPLGWGAWGDGWGLRSWGAAREGGDGHSMARSIPILCSPNPGTYRHGWGSGSWGLTSPGGRGTCSSGCHPHRSHCWHTGCWSSRQYLGRRCS